MNGIRAFFRRGIADEDLDAELHAADDGDPAPNRPWDRSGRGGGVLGQQCPDSVDDDRIAAPDAVNPIALDVGPSWRVLAFATLAAVVRTLLFGIAAAWRVTSRPPR